MLLNGLTSAWPGRLQTTYTVRPLRWCHLHRQPDRVHQVLIAHLCRHAVSNRVATVVARRGAAPGRINRTSHSITSSKRIPKTHRHEANKGFSADIETITPRGRISLSRVVRVGPMAHNDKLSERKTYLAGCANQGCADTARRPSLIMPRTWRSPTRFDK